MYFIFSYSNIITKFPKIILGMFFNIPFLFMLNSQQVNYGRGPGIVNLNGTTVPSQSYGIETGINCPVPSFNVSGFYGQATDTAHTTLLDASSRGGIDNYGVTAGFNIPLGGQLSSYCRDYAAIKTQDASKRLEITNAKYLSDLVKQCNYLFIVLQIDFNKPIYDEDGAGAALFPCREIVKTIESTEPQRESVDPNDHQPQPSEKQPEFSTPEPLTPPAQPVIIVD